MIYKYLCWLLLLSTLLQAKENNNTSFYKTISKQIDHQTNIDGTKFALQKISTNTPETKKLIDSIVEGDFFGLKPYKENYLLPLSIANKNYLRHTANVHPNATLTPLQEKYKYMSNVEAEFQISLIKQMTYNLFGMNEFIFAAFTQHVWWQLYNKSAPFREMNFQPEIFMAIPTSDYMDKTYGLKAFRLGFLHDSNAQEGYRSRSWNRLYISALWQWNNLFCSSRIWYRIPEQRKSKNYYDGNGYNPDGTQTDPNENGDDNPDIEEYFGIGDLTFHYLYGQSEFVSVMRYNFGMGGKQRGSVELDWSYPFLNSTNVFWFTKVFSGYGESLIDYDRSLNKIAFGFSFSRSMF